VHVDANLCYHLAAADPLPMTIVPHSTDQTSACTAECATMHDVPHRKTVATPAFSPVDALQVRNNSVMWQPLKSPELRCCLDN
jgi:hypothetical protein